MSPISVASTRVATDHRPTLVEARAKSPAITGASVSPRLSNKTTGMSTVASQLMAGTTSRPWWRRRLTKGALRSAYRTLGLVRLEHVAGSFMPDPSSPMGVPWLRYAAASSARPSSPRPAKSKAIAP